jgi:hypothetical protein
MREQPRSSYLFATGVAVDFSPNYECFRTDATLSLVRGVFGNDGSARFAEITDDWGLSDTVAVGESWGGRAKTHPYFGPWGLNGAHTSVHGRVHSLGGDWITSLNYRPGTRLGGAKWKEWERNWHLNAPWQGRADGKVHAWVFNSKHAGGGAQFLMCDGSTHWFSEKMDYFTYCTLHYCADGAPRPTLTEEPYNYQLPEMSEWVWASPSGTEDPFMESGVRDPTAPNRLLDNWLSEPASDYSQLDTETAEALQNDTAQIIDLYHVPLTDELRSQLGGLRQVHWLRLCAGVTAADLTWLGRMSQLRGLSLANSDLAGADFQPLVSMQSLQYLTLPHVLMSPEDFSTLPRLNRLETLWLGGHQVTDAYLEHLAEIRLPSLLTLGLENTSITDHGMKRLCEVYDLEFLSLFGSRRVTEESVPSVARMQNLRTLRVGMSGIAPQARRTRAVDRLIRVLPKCYVDYGD